MAERQPEIETETNSDIENSIERTWDHYAYVDDGEHAIVVGVSWGDVDKSGDHWDDHRNTRAVRYQVYACEAGKVGALRAVNTHTVGRENVYNLADAAVEIMEMLIQEDDRTPIEAAQDYWSDGCTEER